MTGQLVLMTGVDCCFTRGELGDRAVAELVLMTDVDCCFTRGERR